jgi:hypothetical protein
MEYVYYYLDLLPDELILILFSKIRKNLKLIQNFGQRYQILYDNFTGIFAKTLDRIGMGSRKDGMKLD